MTTTTNNTAASTVRTSKNDYFATIEGARTIENPEFIEIWVRQKEGSFIDRVVCLPELKSDSQIRMNMERWNFQLVARVYAKSIISITYKGFYNSEKSEQDTSTEKRTGSIGSLIYGNDIEKNDPDALVLNVFMFKAYNFVNQKDSDGNYIKDQSGKYAQVPVGYINNISFDNAANTEMTDKLLSYKLCCLPLTLIIKDLEKIDILVSKTGGAFTVGKEYMYAKKAKLDAYIASVNTANTNPEPEVVAETVSNEQNENVATETNSVVLNANVVPFSELNPEEFADAVVVPEITNNFDDSASDDLPF